MGASFSLTPLIPIKHIALALVATVSLAGCGDDSPTAPIPTPAEATVVEKYVGTLGVGAFGFYSFTVPTFGKVELTLNAVNGPDGSEVALGLGLGAPRGRDCSTSTNTNAPPGTTAQLTATFDPGIYCARVSDVGNLSAAATFDISIAHP